MRDISRRKDIVIQAADKLTTEEKDKKELKECMWEIMKNNGYQKKYKETKQIASKGKQKEERNDEGRWYGLTII